MIVTRMGLGDYLDDIAAGALKDSASTPSAGVQPGQVSLPSPSGSSSIPGSSSGSGGWGDIAKALPGAIKAGTDLVKSATGKGGSAAGVKTSTKNTVDVCKELYDAAKAFVTDAANQTKYKTLLAAQKTNAAWKTYSVETLACKQKFESGAFGKFKEGDTKGNAAAYVKYQACTKAAFDKYKAKIGDDEKWMATFRDAQSYVKDRDSLIAKGYAIIYDCASASDKNLIARLNAASSMSLTTIVIGALVIGAIGYGIWKVVL